MQKTASVILFLFIAAYGHEKINIPVSVLNTIFFLFYGVSLNMQDFIYVEFATFQLGLRRNMPAFAKCNVYISAIQLFYIQACPNRLTITKLIVYLFDCS